MAAFPLFPTVCTTSSIHCKSLQITTFTAKTWAKCGHESSRQTPTLANRPHQQSIHRIADGIQIIIKQIRIHVQGHRRALVTELPLHRLDIRAGMHQQRRARMPQVVYGHRLRDRISQAALLRPVKPARRAAGPCVLRRYEPLRRSGKSRPDCRRPSQASSRHGRSKRGKMTVRSSPRLRHVHHDLMTHLRCRPAHMDTLPLQINVSGLQASSSPQRNPHRPSVSTMGLPSRRRQTT